MVEGNGKIWAGMAFVLAAGLLLGYFIHSFQAPALETGNPVEQIKGKSMEEQRAAYIDLKESIKGKLALEGKYNCCLEKPCSYCLKYDECDCLEEVLNGEHPCGECIGEILEGNGLKDKEVVKMYAKSIAHKVGDRHTGHLKEIIADMYNISVEEQV